MEDNASGGTTSRGQDVKVPIDEEMARSARFESNKLVLDYEDELVKIELTKKKLSDYRELHLIDKKDVDIYEKIDDYIKKNSHESLSEIIEKFQKFPKSDAIAKVLKEYDFPDYILKYEDDKNEDDKNEDDKNDDKNHEKQIRRENFERLLLHAGLILEQEKDPILKCTYIKVFTPFEKLCEQAKIIRLRMHLDPEQLPKIELDPPRKGFFYPITKYFVYEVDFTKQSAVFKRESLGKFKGAGEESTLKFFPSIRRILMTYRIITTANQINRKVYENEKPLIVKKIIKSLAIKKLISDKIFTDYYPLHDGPPIDDVRWEQKNLRAQLIQLWVDPRGGQPLEKIRLYFGEKIALYFAWLGFYTSWLSLASVVGVIVVLYGLMQYHVFHSGKDKNDFSIIWDNALTVPFAFFMAVWSTCYLETWKRYNASIAYDWDVMDYEREELPRPEFYGTIIKKSPITLRNEIHFPFREKVKRLLISGFVVFISFIKHIINRKGITGCDYSSCMLDLTIQLSVIFVGKQIIGQFNESIWPWLRSVFYKNLLQEEIREMEAKYGKSNMARTEAPQWAKDDKLYCAYGIIDNKSTFYLISKVIQFGFISLFGIAFPLAPFLAWINNILEIRFDALKFLTSLQRPIGLRAQDIGMWENILGFISILSVLSNALIIAFHSTWLKGRFVEIYGDDENQILVARLLFILLFENLVFFVKLLFMYLIPDVPREIRIAMDRERYLSNLALEGEQPALDEYLPIPDDESSLFDGGKLKLPILKRKVSDDAA
ncbi:hypothetical protein RclHR1_04330011 [Rhizophagus clarus]|uniref:Uncharacterized protein n=1 Tax=Rhizophagus clarus TaxID=94130 RepID=A0A2Z6RL92_9GLOM|nr:hypothetical protein RclHR1_04330011 [Rhizophagus clarus]